MNTDQSEVKPLTDEEFQIIWQNVYGRIESPDFSEYSTQADYVKAVNEWADKCEEESQPVAKLLNEVERLKSEIASLQSSIAALEEANKWIPVEAGLPTEVKQWYVYDGAEVSKAVYTPRNGFLQGPRRLIGVTHYMPVPPLPEAPVQEKYEVQED